MPELPDVERFRRYLDSNALNREISGVEVPRARVLEQTSPAVMRRTLNGETLGETRRHGKYLFARADGHWLAFHFGLTGSLDVAECDRHRGDASLLLDFKDGTCLAYINPRRLGRVSLVDDPQHFLASKGLGPDALDPSLDFEQFRHLVRGRKAGVKAWLMDQANIAGIGNIYSDEILYQARIHPKRNIASLDDDELQRLYQAMKEVLQQAINVNAELERLPRNYLLPRRGRKGQCPRGHGPLAQLRMGGRTAYFCPVCQPERQ